jgi:hypothetical protein
VRHVLPARTRRRHAGKPIFHSLGKNTGGGVVHEKHKNHTGRPHFGRRSADAPDRYLEKILKLIRSIPHIEVIRIGTRVPVTMPMRIDEELTTMLKKYHPLWINTISTTAEMTDQSALACNRLADSGVVLGNQRFF